MNRMRVQLTFIDEILGSRPNDEEIYSRFIASKAPDAKTTEEEVAEFGAVEVDEKGMTVFPRDEAGVPCIEAYQVKGFFKAACGALRRVDGTKSSKVKAYKKIIDTNIFVYPDANDPCSRHIPIYFVGDISVCQRPLRAQTMQGERVALSSSESIAAGAKIAFDIEFFNESDRDVIIEWLDYGKYNGLGQWRNSGKGAFVWKELSLVEA